MAVFPHGIDDKTVACGNAGWLITLENH